VATTKGYLHLAGTVLPDDAAALERRMLGPGGGNLGYKVARNGIGSLEPAPTRRIHATRGPPDKRPSVF
jgi:hypothetical protein